MYYKNNKPSRSTSSVCSILTAECSDDCHPKCCCLILSGIWWKAPFRELQTGDLLRGRGITSTRCNLSLSSEHLKLSKGNTVFLPLQHRNRELHYRNAKGFIPSLYTEQHPGGGHQNMWGLKEAKPSIMAPTGDAKPGLQIWETLPGTRGGLSVMALHVKATSSVFCSKRMNTGTV